MKKCAFVIDSSLPVGLVANTAAVLALSLGKEFPQMVGMSLPDFDGELHAGLTTMVMPVLKACSEDLFKLREKALGLDRSDLFVVDVSNAAQETRNYDDYAARLKTTHSKDLKYLGLCLFGAANIIKSLTGSLPLLK
jgi:hypothetical protein